MLSIVSSLHSGRLEVALDGNCKIMKCVIYTCSCLPSGCTAGGGTGYKCSVVTTRLLLTLQLH